MKILLTMPGMYGDILSSLPAVRAVAEHYGEPVSLWISNHYGSLQRLIEEQEYIDYCHTDEWELAPTGPVYTAARFDSGDPEPWKAPADFPPSSGTVGFERVAHLQYRGWPVPTCYEACARNAESDLGLEPGTLKVDLKRPWVKSWASAYSFPLVGSWRRDDPSKARFMRALGLRGGVYVAAPDEKLDSALCPVIRANWQETAAIFSYTARWIGCQSGPWVLANAVHHPRIETLEPDERRHDLAFWLPTPGNRRVGWEAIE